MWEDHGTKSSRSSGRRPGAPESGRKRAMEQKNKTQARDAEQAADLLVTVASTLNERLAFTAAELPRGQAMLAEAAQDLRAAFRGRAARTHPAQREDAGR